MRRAIFGSLAGWVAGAAGVLAQAPMQPMPSPYPNYPPAMRGDHQEAPGYEHARQAPPQYGPAPAPSYGPTRGPAQGPAYGSSRGPGYGPMMPPPPGAVMPANNEIPVPAGPMAPAPGGMAGPHYAPVPGRAPQMMPGQQPGVMPGPGGHQGGYVDGGQAPWGQGGWNGYNYGDQCQDGCNSGYGCNNNCGPCPNGPCGPWGRMWINAELLLWWTKGQTLPPLVTSGTGLANPGILGQPGTTIIFGNGRIGEDLRVGARTRVGAWLDQCQTLGVEASFLFLARTDDDFVTDCRVGDVLSRPFFNTDPAVNAQDAELVCIPGVLCGDVAISTSNEFYVADANLRRTLCCSANARLDLLGGFRYAHMYDNLSIRENLTNLDPARGAVGEGFLVEDRFTTTNDFYGGQVGAAGEFRAGKVFLDWRALIALGSTVRNVTIAGQTTFLDPVIGGNPVIQPGGLLAQPSNIGVFRSSDFSVIPELNVNVGYQVSPLLRAYVGYSFLYWNNVARAGEQVNLNVDAQQLPTRAGPGVGVDPQFILRTNDFWAQGVSFGMQLRW